MIVIAHNIRSLHNVGAIFRSADVFGVKEIYLTGCTGSPPRKEIAKTALGSQNRIKWQQREDALDLIRNLQSSGHKMIAIEMDEKSVPISTISKQGNLVLILGNEVEGIEKEILEACDVIAEIQTSGSKQSLNVSVAAGVALFALTEGKG